MTFNQFLTDTRQKIKEELPVFFSERGCEPPEFCSSIFNLEKKNNTVCVFPTASSGSTFYEEGNADMVRLTVALFCNKSATEKGVLQAEKYYSVLIQYIQKSLFGEASSLVESVLCRMDEGEPINGAIFNIEARIMTHTDYGWD